MEIKDWSYEDYPSFDEEIEGVHRIFTDGNEKGTYIFSDVVYSKPDGYPLRLQIITPRTRNTAGKGIKYPCMIYVQGSAWKKQNLNAQIGNVARLSEKGYVVAVMEYRHSGIASFPAIAIDARNAIRFMKVHSDEYGVDENNVFICGNSSGGHTAMFSQIIQNDDEETNDFPGVRGDVRGVISFYGSSSMMLEDGMPTTVNHHLPDSPEGMEIGGVNLREHPELCRAMSVECNIDENTPYPPVLMFHGTKDRTINPRVSVVIYQRLKECGKDVSLYLLEGADHGGSEFWCDEVISLIIDFIQKNRTK